MQYNTAENWSRVSILKIKSFKQKFDVQDR
jgi:hypothetical protein